MKNKKISLVISDDGLVRLPVLFEGVAGKIWEIRLKRKGIIFTGGVERILNSPDSLPTKKAAPFRIVILMGSSFIPKGGCLESVIDDKAEKLGLTKPGSDVSCYVREYISNREMKDLGLTWIWTMHKPIKDPIHGEHMILGSYQAGKQAYFSASLYSRGRNFLPESGFAFLEANTDKIMGTTP